MPIDFVPSDLVTIALLVLLEGLLSADNAMVLAVLVLGLPKEQQRQALRYGIVGAFVFRITATVFAAHMIQFRWVQLVGGLYLLWLPYQHFFRSGGSHDRRTPPKATPWICTSPAWIGLPSVPGPLTHDFTPISCTEGCDGSPFAPGGEMR